MSKTSRPQAACVAPLSGWRTLHRRRGAWVRLSATNWSRLPWPSGSRYEGDFRDGKRTGRGVYTWASGDSYEGEFRDDLFHGRRVHTYADGRRWEGNYVDGKPHGRGSSIQPGAQGAGAQNSAATGRWVALAMAEHDAYGMVWGAPSEEAAIAAAMEECARQTWDTRWMQVRRRVLGAHFALHRAGRLSATLHRWLTAAMGNYLRLGLRRYPRGSRTQCNREQRRRKRIGLDRQLGMRRISPVARKAGRTEPNSPGSAAGEREVRASDGLAERTCDFLGPR